MTLVGPDARWRYLDDGSEPGTAWTDLAFNDRRWSEGLGQFGFGEGDETTVLRSGYRSYFLRQTFTVERIPDRLTLSMLFDDGVSVHLNGHEVTRLNVAEGPVTAQTQALASRWGSDETTAELVTIDPALLIEGDNILAISLHNVWSGNGDVRLDAQLTTDG